MGNQKLIKRIMAGILAVMIGLSALGGIVMAFAAQEPDPDKYTLQEPVTSGVEYIAADEDWELLVIDPDSTVEVQLDDTAKLFITPGSAEHLWLGWTAQSNKVLDRLAEQYWVNLDVVDFVFASELNKLVLMTITTKNPYLYRVDRGELVPVVTEYRDGVHRFMTDKLDCFVAADNEVAF